MKRSSLDVERVMLEETRDDVKHADQKASTLLATLGVGFSLLISAQLQMDWNLHEISVLKAVALWTGIALGLSSVACAAAAIWPRFSVKKSSATAVTYWGHIASLRSVRDLGRELDRRPPRDSLRVRHQLWSLSRLVVLKYRFVRAALVLAGLGVLVLAAATALVK